MTITFQVTLTLSDLSEREMEYFSMDEALEYVARCHKNYTLSILSVLIERVTFGG